MFGVFYAVFASNKNLRVAAFAGDLFFMIRFYVKVLKARQSGNAYAQLFVDLGYRIVRLDKNCSFYDLIPELCGYRDLDDLLKAHPVDDVITLAEFIK